MPCSSPHGIHVYAVLLLQMAEGELPEEAQHQAVIVTQLLSAHDARYDVIAVQGQGRMKYRQTDPYSWMNPRTGGPVQWSKVDLRGWIVPPRSEINVFAAVDSMARKLYVPYYPDEDGQTCQSWANQLIGSLKQLKFFFPVGQC